MFQLLCAMLCWCTLYNYMSAPHEDMFEFPIPIWRLKIFAYRRVALNKVPYLHSQGKHDIVYVTLSMSVPFCFLARMCSSMALCNTTEIDHCEGACTVHKGSWPPRDSMCCTRGLPGSKQGELVSVKWLPGPGLPSFFPRSSQTIYLSWCLSLAFAATCSYSCEDA